MSVLRQMYNPSRNEIWKQLSEKIDAHYIRLEPPARSKIIAKVKEWTVTLDTHTIHTHHDRYEFLRIRAPFVNADGFRFLIYHTSLFESIAKLFGFQDIKTGFEDFDSQFIVQANHEEKIKQLLQPAHIHETIQKYSRIQVEVRSDDGYFNDNFPEGVDELVLLCEDVMQDLDRMEELYGLFADILHQLCQIGSAYESDPEISFD